MSVEIERKFIVVSDEWKTMPRAGRSWKYEQGYLSFGDEGAPEVRVRMISSEDGTPGGEAVMTVKGKGDVSRQEVEFGIDVARAKELLAMCQGTVIQKVRHCIAEKSGLVFEVDVYEGALAGLCVAEIELPSEDSPFDKPSFLGEEVSKDKAYKNASLAKSGLPAAYAPKRPRV